MALTREFRETVMTRVRRDARFRERLFSAAMNAFLGGEVGVGKALLRDLVNSTIGFEGLASRLGTPSKSLHRMLAARGNPSTVNLVRIVDAIQRDTQLRARVTVVRRASIRRRQSVP